MEKNEVIKMLNEELGRKVDAATIDKLKNAKTQKEALDILRGVSVNLSEDALSAISGGEEGVGWCPEKNCDGLLCPGYY